MIPQQGLASLPQAQQGPMQGGPMQGPMPGQAPMQQMPGMMPQQGAPTPAAMVGPLTQMHMQQLVQLMLNPRPDGPPLYAVLSALSEKQKAAKAAQAAQGQQVMAQNAQMQQQPPVAAQVVQAAEQMEPQAYAGGGAVAFTNGGDVEIQRILKKGPYERTPEENEILRAAGIGLIQRQGLPQDSWLSKINKRLEGIFGSTAPVPEQTASYDNEGRIGLASKPTPPSVSTEVRTQPARRPPTGNKPPAMSQGLGSFVEQTGTPAPDALSDIESGGIRDIKALQDVLAKQGTTDPELMKLREAAYKSSQDIAARRERDRQAMLEAGQKQYEDISDLIIGAAGGARGKTFGEVLSGAVGGAGAARTAKRAEFQKVKDAARQEQNAIDQLNQALADKRVADRSGDVSKIEAANRAVAEAQLKVTDLRSGIQKERALQADRAEQREIAREQMANALKVAQTRGALAGERGAITQRDLAKYRFDAEKQVEKLLPEDREYRKLRNDPTAQAAYKENLVRAKVREAALAAGLEPPAGYEKPTTAPTGPATRIRFDSQGNPIK